LRYQNSFKLVEIDWFKILNYLNYFEAEVIYFIIQEEESSANSTCA